MAKVRIPSEVYAGGAIRKYTDIDADGFTEVTQWDESVFLADNKVLRDANTHVDSSGMAWHMGARIPTPLIEQWYKEEFKIGGQAHAAKVTADAKWLLAKCKGRDYQKLLVSGKV